MSSQLQAAEGTALAHTIGRAVTQASRGLVCGVFAAGYVRGADSWHLATALHASADPTELTFVTLDSSQRNVAKRLAFKT